MMPIIPKIAYPNVNLFAGGIHTSIEASRIASVIHVTREEDHHETVAREKRHSGRGLHRLPSEMGGFG
jgi:hypothetical protein